MTADVPLNVSPAAPRRSLLADVFDAASVVVVDDEPANVQVMARMLQSVGVPAVHGVTDSREAVQRCHEVDADLVLLDLRMPHVDGFDVLEQLRASQPDDAFLPVLVLTADTSRTVRDRALQVGATDFLTKPVDRIEVVLRARNLLQTRALYMDAQRRSAALADELAERRAEERRLEEERRDKTARIDEVVTRRGLAMVFQPIVDLATGRAVGAEALARFSGVPPRPPSAWFGEAAAVGRSEDLEVAAAAQALEALDDLPDDVFLAVNVSPETALSTRLHELLAAAPHGRVVLELTEHTRVEDYDTLVTGLAPLRERGIRIAVDDAGAGYAGLQHVLRLRPDLLKLDIGLIRGIDGDPARRALGAALVWFAEETGATLVAEGIETEAESQALQALGVRWGQGYHIARPAPLPWPVP